MNRLLTIEHLEAKGCWELNTFIAKAGHCRAKYISIIGLRGARLSTKLRLRCDFSGWTPLCGWGRIWGGRLPAFGCQVFKAAAGKRLAGQLARTFCYSIREARSKSFTVSPPAS